jgi:hypothetical protein
MTEDELRAAAEALWSGTPLPEGFTAHVDRAPTKADWDALDPNTYETTCAKCGAYVVGTFGPNNECETPCSECGSTEYTGGIGSPAGGMHLALHSDF